MAYKALRKDLTDDTQKCHFCPKYLTSLKAYVLEHIESGETVYAGPICAKNNIGPEVKLSSLPDLTRFTDTANEGNGASGGGGGGGGEGGRDDRKFALEYLMLREQKLADVLKTSYKVLSNYYLQSTNRSLTDDEISHVVNIEAKAPNHLRLTSLQRCYNYLFWINVAIERVDVGKVVFLTSVRDTLIKNHEISISQRDAVNRWLKNIAGVPQLK